MTRLDDVANAVRMGFHVFPVVQGKKIPHPAAGQWGETATGDLQKVVYFWSHVDPFANYGIACKPSQLLVVDLDTAKEDWNLRDTEWEYMHQAYGPRVQGEDLLDEMNYKLGDEEDPRETLTVRTGSGGLHLYYRWPEHWPKISQASPVKGVIDVRGNGGQYGGYVLGPGSVTDAGPYVADGTFSLNAPPEWIRRLVAEKPKQPRPPRRATGILQPSPVSFSGLARTVREAGEGNRNNALLYCARAMYSDGATVDQCKDVLGPAAQEAGLGWFEIERTIESAYRIQRQKEG